MLHQYYKLRISGIDTTRVVPGSNSKHIISVVAGTTEGNASAAGYDCTKRSCSRCRSCRMWPKYRRRRRPKCRGRTLFILCLFCSSALFLRDPRPNETNRLFSGISLFQDRNKVAKLCFGVPDLWVGWKRAQSFLNQDCTATLLFENVPGSEDGLRCSQDREPR